MPVYEGLRRIHRLGHLSPAQGHTVTRSRRAPRLRRPCRCGWRNDLVPSGVVLLNHRPGHAATARQLNLVRRSPRSDRFEVDASGTLGLTTTPDADLLSGLDPLLHVATELLSVTTA